MADNTTLDVGTGGDVIATDDVAGVKYQWVKLADGTADSATKISAGNGTAATALRVTVASDTTGVLHVDDNASTLSVDDGAGSLTVDNGGTFAVQDSQVLVDNAAFTDGTSKLFPTGYIFDDVAGTALTENDVAAPRISSNRATVAAVEDGATRGRYATVTAGNALKIDGSAASQPVTFTDQSVNVHQVNGTTVDTNSGTKSAGTQRVVLATDQPQLTNSLLVQNTPQTTGGLTIGPASGAKLISAASTNGTSVKASAGQVYGWYLFNANATSTMYVKLYNKASAPTVGTDTPVMVIPIPSGAAANVEYSQGIAFATGIALAITTGVADSDTGAVAANDVVVNLLFK